MLLRVLATTLALALNLDISFSDRTHANSVKYTTILHNSNTSI